MQAFLYIALLNQEKQNIKTTQAQKMLGFFTHRKNTMS